MDLNLNIFDYNETGYHGHTQPVINEIVRSGKFNPSDRDWEYLGTGVYFFEDDILQAVRWCKYARKYDQWSVIRAKIKTDKLLDLLDTANFNSFKEFATLLRRKYKKIDGSKKITSKLIFNFLYELEEYDAVRHVFVVGDNPKPIQPTEVTRMQVQLCVRNQDCITDIEEVETDGY